MNIEMENGIQMTLDQWMPEIFQKLIVGASEHPARTSLSLESEPGLVETDHPSFERYFESVGKSGKRIDPNGLSMKMLKECYQATEDLTSLGFSLKWGGWGTISNGLISTANITEYPRTGKEYILLDILEPKAPQKYFLSKQQTERIVFISK